MLINTNLYIINKNILKMIKNYLLNSNTYYYICLNKINKHMKQTLITIAFFAAIILFNLIQWSII